MATTKSTKKTTAKKAKVEEVKDELKEEMELPATAVVTPVSQATGLIFKNKTYDVLKFIAQIVLPAVATLWVAISTIWQLPLSDQIEGTITAVVVFLDTTVGKFNRSNSKVEVASFVHFITNVDDVVVALDARKFGDVFHVVVLLFVCVFAGLCGGCFNFVDFNRHIFYLLYVNVFLYL